MSRNDYGKRYPGSGGARRFPPSGGEPWRPLPEGTFEQVPVTTTVIDEHRPGLIGRLLGQKSTFTERDVVTGYRIKKNYR